MTALCNQCTVCVDRSAAASVGEVVSCDEDRLQAFASLAYDVYGNDIVDWTTVNIATVGNIIGKYNSHKIYSYITCNLWLSTEITTNRK